MFKPFSYAPGKDEDATDLATIFKFFFNISSFYVERRVGIFFFLETKLMGLNTDKNVIILWRSERKEGSTLRSNALSLLKAYEIRFLRGFLSYGGLTLLLTRSRCLFPTFWLNDTTDIRKNMTRRVPLSNFLQLQLKTQQKTLKRKKGNHLHCRHL